MTLTGEIPSWQERTDYDYIYDDSLNMQIYHRIPSGSQLWETNLNVNQSLPWGGSLNLAGRMYRRRWYVEYPDISNDETEYSLLRRVSYTQPILAGNPVHRSQLSGRISREDNQIDFELRIRDIKYQTTQAFFDLVLTVGHVEIARNDLERGRASEDLARRKMLAGLIPEVELLQIQVDLARRESSYQQALRSVEAAADELRILTGFSFIRPIVPRYQIGSLKQKEFRVHQVEGERLEMRKARQNLSLHEIETKASKLTERVRASLEIFYEVDTRRENPGDLDETGDRNIGGMLQVSIPVFGFGYTRGRIEVLRANLARARVNVEALEARHAAELRRVVRNVELTLERIRIADAALELSERSFDITTERYDSGLVNSRDLLDSQLELTRTRREALTARIDHELALARLNLIAPKGDG